jgi:hypothetical protein
LPPIWPSYRGRSYGWSGIWGPRGGRCRSWVPSRILGRAWGITSLRLVNNGYSGHRLWGWNGHIGDHIERGFALKGLIAA